MIDQQKGTEAGVSGDDLGAPFSLSALSKSALTPHRRWLVVVWACGHRAPSGDGSAGGGPSLLIYRQTPTAACASDEAAPITGAWGPSATNKRHRVYTRALLAHYYQPL